MKIPGRSPITQAQMDEFSAKLDAALTAKKWGDSDLARAAFGTEETNGRDRVNA